MSKTFTLLTASALAFSANAQTLSLNDPDNVPVVGSQFPVHLAAYAAPPVGGTGLIFDYSGLTETGMGTWNWIDPSVYSNPSAFPTAEVAATNGTDTIFYRTTSSGLERLGERQSILIYNVEVPLSDPSLQLKLPLAYGQSWNDNIAGTFQIDQTTSASRTGSIYGIADANGWLVLPGGGPGIEVLRVRTDLQELNAIDGGINVVHKRHEYAYYAAFLKTPLLKIYSDSLLSLFSSFASGIEWIDADPVGLAEAAASSSAFSIYPNPASDNVTIVCSTEQRGEIHNEVVDATGRVVVDQLMDDKTSQLNTGSLRPGCYVVRLRSEKGIIASQRLVKY